METIQDGRQTVILKTELIENYNVYHNYSF
jgi:hypothetical protein